MAVLTLVLLAWWTPPARAQSPPPGLPAVVSVDQSGLDGERVKAAIEQELGVSLRIDPSSEVRLEVVVTGHRASVVYHSPGRDPVTRSVDLPKDPERATETIAFLAGNLARDEAEALLDELRAREPVPPPPAPPPAEAAAEVKPSEEATPPVPVAPAKKPAPPPAPPAEKADKLVDSSVNLSLYYPLTLLRNTEQRRLKVELGFLYSRVGAIRGVGASLGVLRVEGPVKGITGALIWNRSGPTRGLHLAGFVNEGYDELDGISAAGIANLRRGDARGIEFAGIFSSVGRMRGIQSAGMVGLGRSAEGLQLTGLVGVASDEVRGVQFAGMGGFAKRVKGIQLTGITSVASEVTGVQVSSVNVARKVRGLQLGLVNVADEIDGGALGLVSIARNGRVQPLVWLSGGGNLAVNGGVKFVTGYTYSYLGAGTGLTESGYRIEGGAGAHLTFLPFLFGEAGLAYAQERRTTEFGSDPLRQELRYDLRLGADIARLASPFVGGGLAQRLTGEGPDFRGEFSLGVALF
jgi:hypothetical protein